MKYLSLFSGIEAATQAWHQLGWEPVAFSEIENFPNAVLEHHYPDVPNLGDVTKITENKIKKLGQIDLVVFGSPCQDLSVAGKRKGLDGERSGLFTTAIKIIKWARKHNGCRYALWENVPGAFSSNGGKDFGEVIKLLSGSEFRQEKYQTAGVVIGKEGLVEWRTLDAQHFGVPQRRRRIFALADFGNWESRGPILFERESVFGDIAKSGEKRKETPTDARGCLASGSGTPRVAGTLDTECGGGKLTHQSVANGHIITHPQDSTSGTLTARMMNALGARDVEEGAVMPVTVWQPNLSAPLSARDYKGPGTDGINEETTNNMVVYDTVGALCARDYKGVGNQFVDEGKVIPAIALQGGGETSQNSQGSGWNEDVSFTLNSVDKHGVAYPINTMTCQGRPSDDRNPRMGLGVGEDGDPQNTLSSSHHHAVAFTQNDGGRDATENTAPTLRSGGDGGIPQSAVAYTAAFKSGQGAKSRSIGYSEKVSPTLPSNAGGNTAPAVMTSMQVRRLTPKECERLQGFPDDFTKIPYRKKDASDCPDGPRYKALGNSMAVPVMRWIGERINQAD
jgi:DNA (cytosine-5)-methyltransferase 1